MRMMAVPSSARSVRISSRICAWMVTSSAVVGSSAISSCGIAGERHGDHHALAHAAGELVRILERAALGRGDAHAAQHVHRLLLRFIIADFSMPQQHLGDLVARPGTPD